MAKIVLLEMQDDKWVESDNGGTIRKSCKACIFSDLEECESVSLALACEKLDCNENNYFGVSNE